MMDEILILSSDHQIILFLLLLLLISPSSTSSSSYSPRYRALDKLRSHLIEQKEKEKK
jgi:hypothetical protein